MKRTLKYLYAIRDKLRETVLVDPKEIADKLVFFHDKNGLIHFPVSTDGRVPIEAIPLESDLHFYRRKCTNGAVNDGVHSVKLEPAADSIVLIFFISSINRDTVAVDHTHNLYTAGGSKVTILGYVVAAAGIVCVSPRNVQSESFMEALHGTPSYILTDVLEVMMYTGTVAVSQDTDFFMLYSYIGDAPTITETGPAGATWSDIA